MAAPDDPHPYALTTSPSDTLVRQTSRRATNNRPARIPSPSNNNDTQKYQHQQQHHHQQQRDSYHYHPSAAQPPPSPLLHGHFAGQPTHTININMNSYNQRSSVDSRSTYQDIGSRFHADEESIYSHQTADPPALRDSWHSTASRRTQQQDQSSYIPNLGDPSYKNVMQIHPNPLQYDYRRSASPNSSFPTVVVSSPDAHPATNGGRALIVQSTTSHYSRPGRQEVALPLDDQEAKRRVLERNQRQGHSPQNSPNHPLMGMDDHSSPLQFQMGPGSPSMMQSGYQPAHSPHYQSPSASSRPSPCMLNSNIPMTANKQSFQGQILVPKDVSLSTRAPLRQNSSGSLYSTYSYYQYDSPVPSPTGPGSLMNNTKPGNNQATHLAHGAPPTEMAEGQGLKVSLTEATAKTPQDFLQLGIQHHEANRLKESAICFERSAKEQGGCGVGMLMYGLTLRHGWGCEKNEKIGFNWLRKAAEHAVEDLESAKGVGGASTAAIQNELIIAIYEVGQCFFQGWGVVKDQKMAVSYYRVAARLGDPDAQADLGFCLTNGKGCKKDMKEAALWYRAAVKQGQSDIGLAWIYKDKYL